MTFRKQRAVVAAVLLIAGLVFYQLVWAEHVTVGYFRSLGTSNWTAAVLVLVMGGAWAFALPASVFYFIVPLLYDPIPSTLVMTAGSTFGGLTGYSAARYVGGPWIERFRTHRVTRFLSTHSTFATLFAIRVVPSSPHGFINYGAGLVEVPIVPFLAATALGTAIKAFVYASAVHAAVEATSLSDALTAESVGLLFAIALLSIAGRIIARRWLSSES